MGKGAAPVVPVGAVVHAFAHRCGSYGYASLRYASTVGKGVIGFACFQRVIGKVHWRQISCFVRPFLDDCGIKGPKDRYNEAEISTGIRRFVYEHAQIFEKYVHDVWTSG